MRFGMPGSRARVPGRTPTSKLSRGFMDSASNKWPQPFTSNGSTNPMYVNFGFRGIYDAVSNKTFVSWEGWTGHCRVPRFAYYDHTKKAWSPTYRSAANELNNDAHGNPGMIMDANGYLHAFWGAHFNNGGCHHASTLNPRDISAWALQPGIPWRTTAGIDEYPDAYVVGSNNMVMLTRWQGVGANDFDIGYIGPSAISANGTVPSWTAGKQIIIGTPTSGTLVQNGRIYWTSTQLRGSELHFVATRTDNIVTMAQNIYYYRLDTTNGNIKNFDGSITVVPASQPIGFATSDGSGAGPSGFKILDNPNPTIGQIAQMDWDTNGGCHVIYADAAGCPIRQAGNAIPVKGGFDVRIISNFGSGWSAPVTIGRISSWLGIGVMIVPGPKGTMYATWLDVSFNSWGFVMSTRSPGVSGTWGPLKRLVPMELIRGYQVGLGAARVSNAHPDFRMLMSGSGALADSDLDPVNGNNWIWAWGDRGFIRGPASYNAAPSVISWSPGFTHSGLILSNANMSCAHGSVSTSGNFSASTATLGVLAGQSCYWEVTADASETGTGNNGAGVIGYPWSTNNNWFGGTNWVGIDNSSCGIFSDGNNFINNASIGNFPADKWTSPTGNIGFALANLSSGVTMWWRVNGGTWRPSGTPGVSGGQPLQAYHEWIPTLCLADPNVKYSLKVLPNSWTYTPPAGFSAIGAVA